MAVFTAIVAGISYSDGLYLIRYAGADGYLAYLYPLIPDGLILISSLKLNRSGVRSGWAMAGIILGVLMTLAMNIGAGILHNWLYALADGCVPLVFFVALKNFEAAPERDRDGTTLAVPAAQLNQDEPAEPRTRDVILLELVSTGPRQEVADYLGVPKSRVQRWATELPKAVQDGPAEAAPDSASAYWDGSFEAAAEPAMNGAAAGA